MKFSLIIQFFPEAIKTKPELFKLAELQDLDATLTTLDNQPKETIQKLKDWFKNHTNVRDTIINFATANREKVKTTRRKQIDEAEILQNLYELQQINQKSISANIKNQPQSPQSTTKA
ncbi:MAG: hypothetical protein AB4426_12890 [Xenococcaceae cyanobacterium]